LRRQVTPVLPTRVSQRVCEYLNLLDREGSGFVQGVYLVGSVALGDYQEGRSDIDFVALVAALPGVPDLESLARIHAAMATSEGPHFDGFYIEQDQLGRTPSLGKRAPFSLHGVFRSDAACPEINPVTWLCLAHHGIAVRGRPPETLGITIGPALLQAFQVNNLRTYWEPWIDDGSKALACKAPDELVGAAVLAWGVLGTLRIACTLETGRIVSKSAAGRWALTRYPPDRHPVVHDALSARRSAVSRLPVSRCRDALEFMRSVVSDVLASAKS
jgi:Domain of unknown function (DUF4111)/Nucleotidyltransferase domain